MQCNAMQCNAMSCHVMSCHVMYKHHVYVQYTRVCMYIYKYIYIYIYIYIHSYTHTHTHVICIMIDSGNAEPSCPATRAPQLFTCSAPCEFFARSVARPRPRSTWHRSFEFKFFQALTALTSDPLVSANLSGDAFSMAYEPCSWSQLFGHWMCDCACSVMLQFGRHAHAYAIPSCSPSYTNVVGFSTLNWLNSPVLSCTFHTRAWLLVAITRGSVRP